MAALLGGMGTDTPDRGLERNQHEETKGDEHVSAPLHPGAAAARLTEALVALNYNPKVCNIELDLLVGTLFLFSLPYRQPEVLWVKFCH